MACEICDYSPEVCQHNAAEILQELRHFKSERDHFAALIDEVLGILSPKAIQREEVVWAVTEAMKERDAALAKVGRHVTVADTESASYKIGFSNGAHQMRREVMEVLRCTLPKLDSIYIEPN